MASPYWGASLSRRWQVFERGPVKGLSDSDWRQKPARDALSVTRGTLLLNSGCAFPCSANRAIGEVTIRHWSNGGIRLPNHGQDFATLTSGSTRDCLASVARTNTQSTPHSISTGRWPPTAELRKRSLAMSDNQLEQIIGKARRLKELRRAKERVRQLERECAENPQGLRSQPGSPNSYARRQAVDWRISPVPI